jgi:hypothetical protein
VLDEGTNWKGRAQKIQLLQAKVKELQRAADTPRADDGPRDAGDSPALSVHASRYARAPA